MASRLSGIILYSLVFMPAAISLGYGERLFTAGIIRSYDNSIGIFLNHRAHQRPFQTVALSAAAKNHAQPSLSELP